MDSSRWEQIQTLFHQALECPEAYRFAFIRAAASGDDDLAAEVANMLDADEGRVSVLDWNLHDIAGQLIGGAPDPASFREFGPYRITKLLGEGGMGVVWLAERRDAGNQVAIKFLPHAALSPARRENFSREIRTLARLRHPFIARLYDAGTLDDGTPWFAMEYVDGLGLTEYVRQHAASVEERLRLFRSICEAVQYAHGQEIIHRDLKPSNILVEQDGTPRLLDFGIAKQLQKLELPEDQTRPGLQFLSRDYAAPEWVCDGTVGFQTDVFSLGVILYEMLTGRLPEGDAEKPSDAAGREVAVSKAGWNDLDVLCLKAMHNDPNARYPSAEAVIRDVDHYLRDEPLEARPDSFRYRLGKFVRRNRDLVLAACAALVLLAALSTFFTVRLIRAHNSVLAEAMRTQRIERFMENLFDGGDRDEGPSGDLRVITLLDRGVQQAQSLSSDPTTQADLFETLGSIYRKLGKFERSETLLDASLERRKAMGDADASTLANNLLAIGQLRADQARWTESEGLIRETLGISSRQLSPGDPIALKATAALANVLEERGQYEQAVEILDRALHGQPARNASTGEYADSLTVLADAQFYLGHYPVSDSLNHRALELRRQLYGSRHPRVAQNFINLGNVQVQLGNYAQAEQDFRQALAILQAWYGKDHPESARAETYVAQTLMWQSRYPESRHLLDHALRVTEDSYGKNHPRVALVLSSLGVLATFNSNYGEAEAHCRRMVEIYRSAYGEEHQMTAVALLNLASVYMKEDQDARAERVFRQAVAIYDKVLPPGHLNTAIAEIKLGRSLVRQKRYREAERYTLAGYSVLEKQTNPSLDYLQGARADLVRIYEALGAAEKATRFRQELAANNAPKEEAAKRK